jgi:hypothetical protein
MKGNLNLSSQRRQFKLYIPHPEQSGFSDSRR